MKTDSFIMAKPSIYEKYPVDYEHDLVIQHLAEIVERLAEVAVFLERDRRSAPKRLAHDIEILLHHCGCGQNKCVPEENIEK